MGQNSPIMFHELSLDDFRTMFNLSDSAYLTEDIVMVDAGPGMAASIFKYPCRFDGYALFYCRKGHFQIDVNLTSFEVGEGSLLIYSPGNIVKVNSDSRDSDGEPDYAIIALNREIVSGLRFDFSKMLEESISLLNNPCIDMRPDERAILRNYYLLLNSIRRSDVPNTKEAIVSLAASACHLLGGIWTANIAEARSRQSPQSVRSKLIFENFLALVTQHHASQRNVSFYADKLCLTPKYLSKLVRVVSGRSAPEWIDSYVILEAKNMLKYSDISIKEIVFRLHFPDQSSFYKFFKSRTGMIPSEYRQIG